MILIDGVYVFIEQWRFGNKWENVSRYLKDILCCVFSPRDTELYLWGCDQCNDTFPHCYRPIYICGVI